VKLGVLRRIKMRTKDCDKFRRLIIVLLITLIFSSCSEENNSNHNNDNTSSDQTPQSGEIDQTFGTNGIVITEVSGYYDVPRKVISQQDGLILVAGESFDGTNSSFAVSRYSSSGVLDETYGNNGKATALITISGGSTSLGGAVQQSDGKIILAGMGYNGTDNDIVLVRFGTDGVLDSSFGVGGIYRSDVGTNEGAYAIAIQEDGRILVAGFAENEIDHDSDFLIARYTTAGAPDPSFGTNGFVATPFASDYGECRIAVFNKLAILNDGSIIAAGSATTIYQTTTENRLAIARYTSDGYVDTTFGTPNLIVDVYGYLASDMVLQDNDRIIIATSNEYNKEFSLIRFDQNGLIDLSFGSSGIALAAIGDYDSESSALALQNDGRIIVAGETYQDGKFVLTLAKFDTNGALDSTFGEGGSVLTTMTTANGYASSLAIQADGKILTAGAVETAGSVSAFGIVRIYP